MPQFRHEITILYLLIFILLTFFMKLWAAMTSELSPSEKIKFIAWAPALDPSTIEKSAESSSRGKVELIILFLFELFLLALIYHFRRNLFVSEAWPIDAYIALVPFYLLTDCIGKGVQLLSLRLGRLMPPLHRKIFQAVTLKEFWGNRWNTYFSDWFRRQLFREFGEKPLLGIFLVYTFSGLFHELIVNVPLFVCDRVNLFGSMSLYFWIQLFGVVLERRMNVSSVASRRIFTWLVIIIPAPLVINLGTLRIFMFLS